MTTKINQSLHELEWTRPLEHPERKHNRYSVSFPPSFLEKLSENLVSTPFQRPHMHTGKMRARELIATKGHPACCLPHGWLDDTQHFENLLEES